MVLTLEELHDFHSNEYRDRQGNRLTGCSAGAVLRKLQLNRPDVHRDVLDGKYVKIRKYDNSVVVDLTAAQVAAGWLYTEDCVYVLLAVGTPRYKIGWGKKLRRRISTIENASPYPIEMILAIPSNDAEILEKNLHIKFHHRRCYREWFELSKCDLDYLRKL